jgi:hypothetical protein
MNVSDYKFEHCNQVAAQLKSNGFTAMVKKNHNGFGWHIACNTVAGMMEYTCSEETVMADYYRFINHYGSKLSRWGLDNKIASYKY